MLADDGSAFFGVNDIVY